MTCLTSPASAGPRALAGTDPAAVEKHRSPANGKRRGPRWARSCSSAPGWRGCWWVPEDVGQMLAGLWSSSRIFGVAPVLLGTPGHLQAECLLTPPTGTQVSTSWLRNAAAPLGMSPEAQHSANVLGPSRARALSLPSRETSLEASTSPSEAL